MPSERFITGQKMLQQVDGKGGDAVVESLKDIAPDFARYLLEFPFGDIYARPGLDLRSREIATVAALTAMGTATPQLKVHIAAALHVGRKQALAVPIRTPDFKITLEKYVKVSPDSRTGVKPITPAPSTSVNPKPRS